MSEPGRWAIAVHGGAKTIPSDEAEAHRRGCLQALEAGRAILAVGGSAVDAAEAAVRVLEDDPTFNAGCGSVRNADGDVECDAGIMEGAGLRVGAVRRIAHPISTAVAMLDADPVLLVGEGAEAFARAQGQAMCDPAALQASGRQPIGRDTVGCVVQDGQGLIVAATSTGGLEGSPPGRIGDSPIPGGGLYADNRIGGVALSGEGESILRLSLAARAMFLLEEFPPDLALTRCLEALERIGGEGGLILLDADGLFAWAHNSANFAVAHAASDSPPRAFLARYEDTGETF
jgi:beta-aspartyl-peptidase (threonine type)